MDKRHLTMLCKKIISFSSMKNDMDVMVDDLNEMLFCRISLILDNAKDFFFEENYVETEWKDMVSMHYVNTIYNCKNKVARIHFFSDTCCVHKKNNDLLKDSASNDNYLGYITIRPIPEPLIMLSFVCPNFDNFNPFDNSTILQYKQIVHINERDFNISTFPHFSQDSIATVCANAVLTMMSKYMHFKYRYKYLRIKDMNETRMYPYPNPGFSSNETLNIAQKNNIPLRVIEKRENADELIKTYILSGLPVLIFSDDHIVLIIGIIQNDEGNHYVVYDDSGAFFKSKNNNKPIVSNEKMQEHFVNEVDWKSINEWMNQENNGILIPIFERVVLSFDQVKEIFVEYLYTSNGIDVDVSNDDFINMFKNDVKNIRICNSSKLKAFLKKNISLVDDDDSRSIINDFINNYTEHYVWISYDINSFDNDKGYGYLMMINPTIFQYSLQYEPILTYVKKDFLSIIENL